MQHLIRYGLVLVGIYLLGIRPALAQQKTGDSTSVIHILHADTLNNITRDSVQLARFIGNASFRQGNTIISCDSAFKNSLSNQLDAYGHVHINQADSVQVYGDYLHYEGNTKMATLKGNARLTDGKVNISGPELQYDMNARIGTYTQGGKLINGTSTLTSKEGFYYADTKDVYFKYNVLLVDPSYTLTTDTLLYNTDTKIATMVAPTTINDGKTVMYTTSGYYNTETGYGNFGSRPTIEDSTGTITADNIETDKVTGYSYATGNMVYRDTANHMSLLSNYGKVNQANKTVLATQHPLLILEREKDTLYMVADTLFSGIMRGDSIITAPVKRPGIDSLAQDTAAPEKIKAPASLPPADSIKSMLLPDSTGADSLLQHSKAPADSILQKAKTDTTGELADSVIRRAKAVAGNPLPPAKPDSAGIMADSLLQKSGTGIIRKAVTDSLAAPPANTIIRPAKDTSIVRKSPLPAGKRLQQKNKGLMPRSPQDTTALAPPRDTVKPDTVERRYILAYHHVRIYSDSLQGVADSLFYSSRDSVFRFYRNPVLWANDTQLSGDTIYLYTKNQQADKLVLQPNALIVNESEPGKPLYNQIKGNIITGYFAGNSLDWMHVDGNAESIYYVKDDDGGYISVNKSLSAIINIHFKAGELNKVVFIKDPEGTMYPFTQRPKDQLLLENFRWDIKRKPKSKYELMGQ